MNYRMRTKAGSAGVAISNGGLSKYKSESKLPTLVSKHSTSLANFKEISGVPMPPNESRPTAPPSFFDVGGNESLPRLGSKPILKSSASQPPRTFSKLVRIKDDEEEKNKSVVKEEDEFLKPCPLGCGRKFGEENIEKHMKICQKVFTGKRDTFDISKKRWAKNFKK